MDFENTYAHIQSTFQPKIAILLNVATLINSRKTANCLLNGVLIHSMIRL